MKKYRPDQITEYRPFYVVLYFCEGELVVPFILACAKQTFARDPALLKDWWIEGVRNRAGRFVPDDSERLNST